MLKGVLSLLVLALASMFALPADAADPVKAALQAGGDRLVSLQNADGGWFFTVGDTDCGFGAGVSCPNTFGVTALGLVDTFAVVKDQDFKAAAFSTADALLAKHSAAPPCDGNPATSADRPFTVDVSYLYSNILAMKYRVAARQWFECVMQDFPSASDRADNRINGRIAQGLDNLGAWDAGLDIRAGIAVGEKAYALAEALQVIARQGDWDVNDLDCFGCELLAKGLLIAATWDLRGNGAVKSAINGWVSDLLAAQGPDGSWGGGDTQTTAYALIGIKKKGTVAAVKSAINYGVAFLLSQQLGNGGFAIGSYAPSAEITEVNSEALQALRATR